MIFCSKNGDEQSSQYAMPFIGFIYMKILIAVMFRIKMRLSVIEASDRLVDLINPDKPEVYELEDPLMGPKVILFPRINFNI